MIKFLSNWIGQIAIAVIIVSIFEMVLPKGNLKKYIKVVLGIYEKYTTSNIIQSSINQESMDERLEKLYIEELEKNINIKLNEFGYEIYKCKIDANLNSNKENPGIHRINLIIKENKKNQIQIDDVEIENTYEMPEDKVSIISKVEELKQVIANYLEIGKEIIIVKIK